MGTLLHPTSPQEGVYYQALTPTYGFGNTNPLMNMAQILGAGNNAQTGQYFGQLVNTIMGMLNPNSSLYSNLLGNGSLQSLGTPATLANMINATGGYDQQIGNPARQQLDAMSGWMSQYNKGLLASAINGSGNVGGGSGPGGANIFDAKVAAQFAPVATAAYEHASDPFVHQMGNVANSILNYQIYLKQLAAQSALQAAQGLVSNFEQTAFTPNQQVAAPVMQSYGPSISQAPQANSGMMGGLPKGGGGGGGGGTGAGGGGGVPGGDGGGDWGGNSGASGGWGLTPAPGGPMDYTDYTGGGYG